MIRNPMTISINTITLEVWCKTTIGGTSIVSYASSGIDNAFLLFDPSSLSLYTPNTSVASGINITDGNWRQLIRTSNRTTGAEILYVNGVSAFSTTLDAGALLTSGGSLVIAQEQDTVGGGFDPAQAFGGNISIVRLYNRILSAAEVKSNFESARGRHGI
jgi:C-type mannose receptor